MREKRVDELGRQLREDGLAESPPFSAELHQRVMEGLRAKGLELAEGDDGAARGNGLRFFVRRVVPLAVAAGIGVVAFVVVWPHGEVTPEDHRVVGGAGVKYQPILPEGLVKPLQEQVTTPTAEAWERGKYGYLDQDARRLAIFVASQLPGVPVAEGNDGN